MDSITHYKRTIVQGLLITCPLGVALESCPASTARELPLVKRVAFARKLESAQVDLILSCHRQCLRKRGI